MADSATIDINTFSLPELFAPNLSLVDTLNQLASKHPSFNAKLQISAHKPHELQLILTVK